MVGDFENVRRLVAGLESPPLPFFESSDFFLQLLYCHTDCPFLSWIPTLSSRAKNAAVVPKRRIPAKPGHTRPSNRLRRLFQRVSLAIFLPSNENSAA